VSAPAVGASSALREGPVAAGPVDFCGLRLAHRVINGSGTFDVRAARRAFGEVVERELPFAAYVSKTITIEPRVGNPPPRLWESAGGLINSIGLPNPGLDAYMSHEIDLLSGLSTVTPAGQRVPVPLITNVMGASADELARLVEACQERPQIAAIELNVSCPNVKSGLDIGADPAELEAVVARTRPLSEKPLIVKLTPNCADVAACAVAAEAAGADAVSLINTLRALALAPPGAREARLTWLGGRTGGLSGPAVRVVALAQVAAVAARVSIPVIGMGGVQSAAHARDLIDVGATLVAVGTENFREPAIATAIARAL
jgi:dihydroorotate dehydrogenase (NAD+) catalytic subunit